MGHIEMDFRKAMRQADHLNEIAERLKTLSDNNLENTLNNISNNWISNASNNFCNKGRKVENDILAIAREIENSAANIRSIARRVYEAEKHAEEIARGRSYKNG